MIKVLQSEAKNTHFAPEWKAELYEVNINDYSLCNEIAEVILTKEKQIIQKYSNIKGDGSTGLGDNSLTSKFGKFNIFSWDEGCIIKFQKFIRQEYGNFIQNLGVKKEDCMIQCWANVMRRGEKIEPHWHSSNADTYLSAHFCVKTDNTSTLYQNPYKPNQWVPFENKIGNLLFFPAWMVHCTTEQITNDIRITIALDLVPTRTLNNHPYPDNFVKF